MAQPLTRRQQEVLTFVMTFIRKMGYAPSLEEIGRKLGLSSLATVHKHLGNLEDKGFIKRGWNRARFIEILSPEDCPYCGHKLSLSSIDSEAKVGDTSGAAEMGIRPPASVFANEG